jgi:hypothetical protein
MVKVKIHKHIKETDCPECRKDINVIAWIENYKTNNFWYPEYWRTSQ